MKPPVFDYIAATSVDMAVAALAEAGGEAKIIAGGQSLVPMLNFRLLRPVDPGRYQSHRRPGLHRGDRGPTSASAR